MKDIQLPVLVCIALSIWASTAFAEDVESKDVESKDVQAIEELEEAEECTDVNGLGCEGIGQEADALPSAGSVPLDALGESIEQGEEQFSGCTASPMGHDSSSAILILWGIALLFVARNMRNKRGLHG